MRLASHLVVASLLLPLTQAPAAAQAPGACTIDSAAHTQTFDLFLSLVTPDSVPEDHRPAYQAAAIALAGAFRQPSPMTLPSWPGTYLPAATQTGTPLRPWFGLGGYLNLELRKDGRLKQDRVRATSGSPELADALRAAARRADSSHAFPPLQAKQFPRNGRIVLELQESLQPPPGAIAIARARLRALVIDQGPILERAGVPHYPMAAIRPKPVEGHVHFQFVIRPDGTPDPASFVLLETNYREFADASYRALQESTYFPARIGACPVPVLVHQRVRFQVSR